MKTGGDSRPTGELGLKVIRSSARFWPAAINLREIVRHGLPRLGLTDEINRWRMSNQRHLGRGMRRVAVGKLGGVPHVYGALFLDVIRADGEEVPLGLASLRVVTDTGVAFLVDSMQNLTEPDTMKFHGFGTGTTAEAASQTALVTEETTQYNPDNTRPTGSQAENGAAVYRTVATYSPDTGGTRAITEHGVFSQAATGGGVMLDRSVFAAVNLVAGSDSLQATYDLTIASGG